MVLDREIFPPEEVEPVASPRCPCHDILYYSPGTGIYGPGGAYGGGPGGGSGGGGGGEFPIPSGCIGTTLVATTYSTDGCGEGYEWVNTYFEADERFKANVTDLVSKFIVYTTSPIRSNGGACCPVTSNMLDYAYGAAMFWVSEDNMETWKALDLGSWGADLCFQPGETKYDRILHPYNRGARSFRMDNVSHVGISVYNAGHPFFRSCNQTYVRGLVICAPRAD